jgi:hypothetical protein
MLASKSTNRPKQAGNKQICIALLCLLPQGEPSPPRTTRIFVARLPPSVSEAQFRAYFEGFGKLADAYMPKDHSKQGYRGIGFVTYVSPDSVEKVRAYSLLLLLFLFHMVAAPCSRLPVVVPEELDIHGTLSGLSATLNTSTVLPAWRTDVMHANQPPKQTIGHSRSVA